MPKLFKRKKLRATAVRRPLRIGATTANYGELAEPSMKLSRALLIVLPSTRSKLIKARAFHRRHQQLRWQNQQSEFQPQYLHRKSSTLFQPRM